MIDSAFRERRAMKAWGAELRSRRRRHRFNRHAAMVGLILIALLATIAIPPRPRLIWSASPSAAIGLYVVTVPDTLGRGDMVIAWPPEPARRLGASRQYIPFNVPLVKRVAAAPGDTVCAIDRAIFVNGHRIAERRAYDGMGRPMPWWTGCTMLRDGALFLLIDKPLSFDGRYFGPSRREDIIGRARLLWRR